LATIPFFDDAAKLKMIEQKKKRLVHHEEDELLEMEEEETSNRMCPSLKMWDHLDPNFHNDV
jgi:hypothetical protein